MIGWTWNAMDWRLKLLGSVPRTTEQRHFIVRQTSLQHTQGNGALQTLSQHPLHEKLVQSWHPQWSRRGRNQHNTAGALACTMLQSIMLLR